MLAKRSSVETHLLHRVLSQTEKADAGWCAGLQTARNWNPCVGLVGVDVIRSPMEQ